MNECRVAQFFDSRCIYQIWARSISRRLSYWWFTTAFSSGFRRFPKTIRCFVTSVNRSGPDLVDRGDIVRASLHTGQKEQQRLSRPSDISLSGRLIIRLKINENSKEFCN